MKKKTYSRKKNLLALFLSLMMTASTVAALTSCSNDDSSSSSSSDDTTTEETVKDDGLVTNAGFETFNNKDGLNPIVTSVTGWTRSVNSVTSGTALSSKSASGIIDVSDEAWNDLTQTKLSGVTADKLTVDQAKEQWDSMSTMDKLEYYEAWKSANSDGKIAEELSFYQSFNIDSEDLPLLRDKDGKVTSAVANPRTHDYGKEGASGNTKILMLHNEYSNSSYEKLGTAQKFTSSSSVTVKAGTSANFSVWVKTSNLSSSTSEGKEQDAVDKGAYISITHTVGGKTLDPLEVKNINTANVTDNNGWVKYEFALKGSVFADTTFTIVLGLGQSGGTDRFEYVNGYAFFDDIECEIVEHNEYNATGANGEITIETENKTFKADEVGTKFAMNFSGDLGTSALIDSAWEIAPTTQKRSGKTYTAANAESIAKFPSLAGAQTDPSVGAGFDVSKDKYAVYDNVGVALNDPDNAYATAVYNDYFKDHTYLTNEKALVLLSANGVSYTAKSAEITIPAQGRVMYSFFVKTPAMNGFTGAGVKLLDNESEPAISSIDTTTAAPIKVTFVENDVKTEKEIHDGWQQCFFFIYNESETNDAKVQLSLTFGPTAVIDTAKTSYRPGFAVFTGFKSTTMDETEFACATSATYSKVVTLTGETKKESGDNGFDNAAVSSSANIENGYALPKNYKGVYSDSAYVGGAISNTEINAYKNAGLLNKEHAANYTTILETLGGTGATWDSVFGDPVLSATATQPLVIYNDDTQNRQAYGYIGGKVNVAANSYKAVSLRVKVSAGATASIYLVDMDDDTRPLLSVGRKLTYWYDDEGNVLAKDPSSDDFVARKDTAFKLQPNGLYKVNPNWTGAANVDANAYFANLQAYEYNEITKNLMLAKGGVNYDYNDNWKHDGNDGVAFYSYDATNKTAYAYSNKTTLVYDFSTVDLAPRYTAIDTTARTLSTQVTDTQGKWAMVTFYLHTGDADKNYRLEVWSGSRDNTVVNPANTFVAFDAWSVDETQEKINSWLTTKKENKTEGADYFESVYSFYDSAKYLRYDETLDSNKVGNSYEDYLTSSNVSGVAYLRDGYETFVDFAYVNTTTAVDVEEDNSTTPEEESSPATTTNVWLLASSIIIAAVLVLAVASLIIRKAVAKSRRKSGRAPVKTAKAKKQKETKAVKPVKEEKDEDSPYND